MRAALLGPLLSLALVLASCGGDGTEPTGSSARPGVSRARVDAAMRDLCEIASGRLAGADATGEAFFGPTHDALHEVAEAAQPVDGAAAAALLEATFELESALEEPEPAADLPRLAGALASAFADAVEAVGLEARGCPA